MALDFPSNPINGQQYDNYYWDANLGVWTSTGNKTGFQSRIGNLESSAYTRSNVKGTVSQISGNPTGALIESGVGYVRYADGTQICWYNLGGFGALAGNSSSGIWIYPAAFSAAPVIQASAYDPYVTTSTIFYYAGSTTSTQSTIYKIVGSPFANTNYGSAMLTAHGRWY